MIMTPEFCHNLAEFAFRAAGAFIWLAFFAAIAHVVVYSIVELRKSKAPPQQPPKLAAWDKILEGLKGVLDALANLPHWVAIFLAGFALLWLAGERPEFCTPPTVPPPTAPAGK